MAEKTCRRCGSKFICDGDNDCWCEKVQLHKVQMLEIVELYTDCICPDCLKLYEARE